MMQINMEVENCKIEFDCWVERIPHQGETVYVKGFGIEDLPPDRELIVKSVITCLNAVGENRYYVVLNIAEEATK